MIVDNLPANLKVIYSKSVRVAVTTGGVSRIETLASCDYAFIQFLTDTYATFDGRTPSASAGKEFAAKQMILVSKTDAQRARFKAVSADGEIDVDFCSTGA